jgi:hypothetical protein
MSQPTPQQGKRRTSIRSNGSGLLSLSSAGKAKREPVLEILDFTFSWERPWRQGSRTAAELADWKDGLSS